MSERFGSLLKCEAGQMDNVGEEEICQYFRSTEFPLNISEILGIKVFKSYLFL